MSTKQIIAIDSRAFGVPSHRILYLRLLLHAASPPAKSVPSALPVTSFNKFLCLTPLHQLGEMTLCVILWRKAIFTRDKGLIVWVCVCSICVPLFDPTLHCHCITSLMCPRAGFLPYEIPLLSFRLQRYKYCGSVMHSFSPRPNLPFHFFRELFYV